MNLHQSFKTPEEAITRLAELLKEENIKKIDLRSYQGGFKLIFRTQEEKEN